MRVRSEDAVQEIAVGPHKVGWCPAETGLEPVLLKVCGLSVRFVGREKTMHAVEDVTFDVRRREIVGLVGESGCGKTVTALSIILLLPSHTARIVGGAILFDGRDLLTLSEAEMRLVRGRQIGLVFQDPAAYLNPTLA